MEVTNNSDAQFRGLKRSRASRSPSPVQKAYGVSQESSTQPPEHKKLRIDTRATESQRQEIEGNVVPKKQAKPYHMPVTQTSSPSSPRIAETAMEVEYEREEGELDPEPLKKRKHSRNRKPRCPDCAAATKNPTTIAKPSTSTDILTRFMEELDLGKPAVTVAERKSRAKEHRAAAAKLEDEMMELRWKISEKRARIEVHEARAKEYEGLLV